MRNLLLIFLLTGIWFSCDKDDCCILETGDCEDVLIHDSNMFTNAPDDDVTINAAEIEGDCLTISYSYGGGCKEIDVKLIASEEEGLSLPPFKMLRLSLDDDDNCEAWLTKELSFNLAVLKRGDTGEFLLSLQGWDEQLSYKF